MTAQSLSKSLLASLMAIMISSCKINVRVRLYYSWSHLTHPDLSAFTKYFINRGQSNVEFISLYTSILVVIVPYKSLMDVSMRVQIIDD